MYVIRVSDRMRWTVGMLLAVAVLLMGARLVRPAVIERNDAAAVSASLQPNLRPIYSAKTDAKVIALTFDISWGQKMAPKVLDVLKQEEITATFFLSGPWAKNHVELVQRIKTDGHQIESHGQEHVDLNTLGRERAAKNIAAAHAVLEELTGRGPTYIRPPNGAFNPDSVQAAKDLGYATVIWSVDSLDWKNPGVGTIINRTVKLTHPGAIILMHSTKPTWLWYPNVQGAFSISGRYFRGEGGGFLQGGHLHSLVDRRPGGRHHPGGSAGRL